MFMGGAPTSFWTATAPTPSGPWSNPPRLLNGSFLSHDFDIATGPDGTSYIVTDISQGSLSTPTGVLTVPVWPIYVQQLTPDLLSTVNTTATISLIRTAQQLLNDTMGGVNGLSLEAIGFFYNPQTKMYYITAGNTCQNCAGYIFYLYAKSPFGPYTDGGFLSLDGCTGQNKGVMTVPDASGNPVFLAGNLVYRTGLDNLVYNNSIWHADNNQAASSTNFYRLGFNSDGTMQPLDCAAKVQVPLAAGISTPLEPVQYQLDCSIRNWKNVEVVFKTPRSSSNLQFPVFQKTDNLGPTMNNGFRMDAPLYVTLNYVGGSYQTFTFQSSNVSWTPQKVSVAGNSSKQVASVLLSTNATNGCYGTIVMPTNGTTSYNQKNTVTGEDSSLNKAQLYMYSI